MYLTFLSTASSFNAGLWQLTYDPLEILTLCAVNLNLSVLLWLHEAHNSASKLKSTAFYNCTWTCNSKRKWWRGLSLQHVCRAAQKGSSRYQTHCLPKVVQIALTQLRGLCLLSAMESLMLRYSLLVHDYVCMLLYGMHACYNSIMCVSSSQ